LLPQQQLIAAHEHQKKEQKEPAGEQQGRRFVVSKLIKNFFQIKIHPAKV
jgi:hypothetical protein